VSNARSTDFSIITKMFWQILNSDALVVTAEVLCKLISGKRFDLNVLWRIQIKVPVMIAFHLSSSGFFFIVWNWIEIVE
jgi:hypothetical protein